MREILIAAAMFACLGAASLSALYFYPKLPAHHRDDDTNTVVRLVANIFVVITSLVFGLMINASKTAFEATDNNVHAYATQLILLDKSLKVYGAGTREARDRLVTYVKDMFSDSEAFRDFQAEQDYDAEKRLSAVGDALSGLQPVDEYHQSLLADARQQYRHILEQRWTIIEKAEGGIPFAIIAMLTAWLTLIFASFGYRAPQNATIVTMFLVSALLISVSTYLVLDMDIPFSGPIKVSAEPLQRAVVEMQR
jgi:hypothetical protein